MPLGQFDKVQADWDRHLELTAESADGTMRYNAARVLAQTMTAVTRDDSLDEAGRQELKEQYAARALLLLRRAKQQSFFDRPANRELLEWGPDLAPLRKHPHFVQLLKDLKLDEP